jgi:hypothetical protein
VSEGAWGGGGRGNPKINAKSATDTVEDNHAWFGIDSRACHNIKLLNVRWWWLPLTVAELFVGWLHR